MSPLKDYHEIRIPAGFIKELPKILLFFQDWR